ncbi:MAG: hypothetical protein QXF79_05525, partial [Ignisphaera sp.]
MEAVAHAGAGLRCAVSSPRKLGWSFRRPLSRIVEKLEKLSILKDYEFLDAVYREASKRLSPA